MSKAHDDVARRVLRLLVDARIIPVCRYSREDLLSESAYRLVRGGVGLIELSATSPGWLRVLEAVRKSDPEVCVGIGSVTSAAQAREALEAGASFLVSAYAIEEVRSSAGGHLIEGGLTPAEIAHSSQFGLCKLFPAHAVSPEYLRSVLAVLPGRHVMPTGGLRVEDALPWFEAGAAAIGVGGALTDRMDSASVLTQAVAKVRARIE